MIVPDDGGPTTMNVLYKVEDFESLPFNFDAYSHTFEY